MNLWLTIKRLKTQKELRTLELTYIVCCWVVPIILGAIFTLPAMRFRNHDAPGLEDVPAPFWGDATTWCWISHEYKEFRLILFYGPLWIVYFSLVFIYIAVGRMLSRSTSFSK